jgi:hypothetical protein
MIFLYHLHSPSFHINLVDRGNAGAQWLFVVKRFVTPFGVAILMVAA